MRRALQVLLARSRCTTLQQPPAVRALSAGLHQHGSTAASAAPWLSAHAGLASLLEAGRGQQRGGAGGGRCGPAGLVWGQLALARGMQQERSGSDGG